VLPIAVGLFFQLAPKEVDWRQSMKKTHKRSSHKGVPKEVDWRQSMKKNLAKFTNGPHNVITKFHSVHLPIRVFDVK
jgi:hypothetical protein